MWKRLFRYLGEFFQPGTIVQIGIGALVFYYCFETHKVRQTSEAQLEALRNQLDYQANPILNISFRSRPFAEEKKQNKSAVRHVIRFGDGTYEYAPYLVTYSEQPVLRMTVVHFDNESQSHIWSNGFIPVIPGKSEEQLSLTGTPATADNLRDALDYDHNVCESCVEDCLKRTESSFVAIFYCNALGQPYYYKQPYRFEKNGELHMLFPESGALERAPEINRYFSSRRY